MSETKHPICTIKDEATAVCGGLINPLIASGQYLPCPNCQSTELRMIRNINYHPMGFRLACDKCEFEIPESLEIEAYTTEEGVQLAADAWDKYVISLLGAKLFNDGNMEILRFDDEAAVNKDEDDTYFINVDGQKFSLDAMEFLDNASFGDEK